MSCQPLWVRGRGLIKDTKSDLNQSSQLHHFMFYEIGRRQGGDATTGTGMERKWLRYNLGLGSFLALGPFRLSP